MTGAPMQDQPDNDRDWFEDFLKRWTNPKHVYRGWWIVLVGFFLLAVAARAQGGALFELEMEFRQLRTGTDDFPQAFDVYLGLVAAVIVALIVGYAVDRFDPEVVILPILVGAATLSFVAEISDNLWLRYFAWVVIMAALAGVLLIGFAKVVTSWFSRHRGKAFAVLLAGIMLAPALPFPRIHRVGYWLFPYDYSRGVWPDLRQIQLVDPAVLFVVGSAVAYFVLRSRFRNNWSARRESVLLRDDQEPDEEEGPKIAPVDERSRPLKSILFGRSYLLLIAASGLQASVLVLALFTPGYWTNWHIVFPLRKVYSAFPFYDEPGAAYLLGALVLLGTGVLADRFGGRRVLIWTMVAQFACVVAAGSGNIVVDNLAFAIGVGAGAGGLSAAALIVLTEYWGTRHFGVLLGILASATLAAYMLARELYYPAMSEKDYWLLYDWLPYVVLAMLALALLLILLMKRPQSAVPNPPVAETEPQVTSA